MKYFLYIFGGLGALLVALNYGGFCFLKFHRMGDDEYVDAAISKLISYDQQYGSVDEFKKANPNCCVVHRFQNGAGEIANSWGPLFGLYTVTVVVKYKRAWGEGVIDYERHMHVRKCGEAFPGPGIEN